MRLQKIGDALISVDLIFHAGKAVALVFVNLVVDGSAALLDGIDHLLRF